MMQLDDNLTLTDSGTVICTHCQAPLGKTSKEPLANAIRRERPARAAGPGVHADPKNFTTREIVLRQFFCPGCSTVLTTEIVPSDEPSFRHWSLDVKSE
jgi:Acetone carboxylase gamma subunit